MTETDYYLAGPMSGHDKWNFPAFREAAGYLRSCLGSTVISPHELDEAIGFTEDTVDLPDGFMADAMRRDVEALLEVKRIILLPGWQASSGTRFELSVAEMLGLQAWAYDPEGGYGNRVRFLRWPEVHESIRLTDEAAAVAEPAWVWGGEVHPVGTEDVRALPRPEGFDVVTWDLADGTRIEAERRVAEDSVNPKDRIGITKPRLSLVPKSAIIRIAQAFTDGARKYGPFNWRTKAVSATVYVDAAERHLAAYFDGEDVAADSGYLHLAHAGACIGILIDATETGNLIDDRPTPGAAARLIAELTEVPA